jgi:hypothetical protein
MLKFSFKGCEHRLIEIPVTSALEPGDFQIAPTLMAFR